MLGGESRFPYPGFLGNGRAAGAGARAGQGAGAPGEGRHVTESEGESPPPPPAAWSDAPEQHGDTDSESQPSSAHSSVLVDLGKVVGVLRTRPGPDSGVRRLEPAEGNGDVAGESECSVSEEGDEEEEEALVCETCAQEEEEEDCLCGDPLVYATFVAPVQQYSTETEPSRQHSFQQHSSETEAGLLPPTEVGLPLTPICKNCQKGSIFK